MLITVCCAFAVSGIMIIMHNIAASVFFLKRVRWNILPPLALNNLVKMFIFPKILKIFYNSNI